ncbi:LapB repeat-containing protein [Listeria monocytogenes]|nr:LapB repeat-containing protein [Listeria monocytogenes]EKT6045419.1 LapB repeat-containing protein [Listeria monocytogenes]
MKKCALVIALMLLVSTIMPTISLSNTNIPVNSATETTVMEEKTTVSEDKTAKEQSGEQKKDPSSEEATAKSDRAESTNENNSMKETPLVGEEELSSEKPASKSTITEKTFSNLATGLQAASADEGMTYRTGASLSSDQYLEDIHATDVSGLTATADFSDVNVSAVGTYPVKVEYKNGSNQVMETLNREIKIVSPTLLTGWDSKASLSTHSERFYIYADPYHQKIQVLDAVTELADPGDADPRMHSSYPGRPYYELRLLSQGSENKVVLNGDDTVRASLPSLEDWEYSIGDYYEIHCLNGGSIKEYTTATIENLPPHPSAANMTSASSEISGGKYLKLQMGANGFIYVDTITPTLNVANTTVSLEQKTSVTEADFLNLAGVTYSDNMDNQPGDSVTISTDLDEDTITDTVGTQTVTITASDAEGNTVSKTVTVNVTATDITMDEGMTYRTGATLSSDQYLEDIHAAEVAGLTATADLSGVNASAVGTYTVPVQYKNSAGQVAYDLESKLTIVEPIHMDGLGVYSTVNTSRYLVYADAYHQKIKVDFTGFAYEEWNGNYGAVDYVKFSLKSSDGTEKKSVTQKATQVPNDPTLYASVNDWDYEIGDYYQLDHYEGTAHLVNEPNATIAGKPLNPSESNMAGPSSELPAHDHYDRSLKLEMIDTGFQYVDTVAPSSSADAGLTLEYKQVLSEQDYYNMIGLSLSDNMFDEATMSADDYFTVESDYDPAVTNNQSGTFPVAIHVQDASGNKMINQDNNDREVTQNNTITMQTTLPTADAVTPVKQYPLGTDMSAIDVSELVENLDSTVSFVNDVEVVGWDPAHTPSTNTTGTKSGNVLIEDDRGVQASIPVTISITDLTMDDGMTYQTGATLSSDQYLEDIHATLVPGLTATADLSGVDASTVGTYTVPVQYRDSSGQMVESVDRKLSIVEPIHMDGLSYYGAIGRYLIYADAYHQKIKVDLTNGAYGTWNGNYGPVDYVKFSLKSSDGTEKKSVTQKATQYANDPTLYASVNDWDYEIGDYYQLDHYEGTAHLVNEPNATIAGKPLNPSESNMTGPSSELPAHGHYDRSLKLEMIDTGFQYVDTVAPSSSADAGLTLEYKQALSEEDYYDQIHLSLSDNMFDEATMSADDYFTVESDYDPAVTNNQSGTFPVAIHVQDASGNKMINQDNNDREVTQNNTITMQTTLPTADTTPTKHYPLGTDISAIDVSELVENLDSTVSFVNDVEVVGWDPAHTPSGNVVGNQSGNVLIEDDRGVQASIPVTISIDYGDSLYFAASGVDRGGVVLTLADTNDTPTLTLTAGDNDGTTAFDASASSTDYLSTDFYHRKDTTGPITDDSQYAGITVTNGDSLADYTSKYTSEGIAAELQYGDIIAVNYHYQEEITRYDDSVAQTDTTSGGVLYYEVTKDGFELVAEPFGNVQFDQTDGPDDITFESTKVGQGLQTIHREESTYDFSILDTRYQKGWKVYVGITKPLTSTTTGETLDGALIWKSSDGTETTLVPGSTTLEVGSLASTTDVDREKSTLSYGKEEGPLLKYNTSAATADSYETTFEWSIVDAP